MKFIPSIFAFALILSAGSSNAAQEPDPIPAHETFTIASKKVGETRSINIWMPAGYKNSNESLPVLYMADGGLKEDFPHIANTLAELMKAKKINPLILVGIENTQRRRDLTGPTIVKEDKEIAPIVGESEKFSAFINEELFPEVNKRYRTTHEKGIIGESLSGLFVVETFLLHPNMFDYYIAFDPSLWWNNQHLLLTARDHLSNFPSTKKRIWFAGSGTKGIPGPVAQLAKIIEAQHNPNILWNHADEPTLTHDNIFRATKEKALIWTLNAK